MTMVVQAIPASTEIEAALALERGRLLRLCARLSGDADGAEDLAQETLVEAWRHWHDLREPERRQQWLAGIARNVCLRWLRSQGREQSHLLRSTPGDEMPSLEVRLADDFDLELELERDELASLLDRAMAQLLPWALVGPFAGVLVDRWPRRRVMVACDLARAAVVLGLIVAPSLLPLLALVCAKFVLSTFFSPARWAAIQATVPEEDLLTANLLGRLSVNATKMLGPVLGGVLVAFAGARSAFVADSLTFLCSAALLSRLPLLAPVAVAAVTKRTKERDFWGEFRGGLACILQRRALLLAVGAIVLEMGIVESNDSLTALACKGVGMSAELVGVAIGCSGLGNILGAMLVGQWGSSDVGSRAFGIMGAGKLLVAATEVGIGAALVLGVQGGAVWLPLGVVAGIGFASIWTPFGSILQQETPPELMGVFRAARPASTPPSASSARRAALRSPSESALAPSTSSPAVLSPCSASPSFCSALRPPANPRKACCRLFRIAGLQSPLRTWRSGRMLRPSNPHAIEARMAKPPAAGNNLLRLSVLRNL